MPASCVPTTKLPSRSSQAAVTFASKGTCKKLPSGFFLMMRPPPKSPLFPYTTLFRSGGGRALLADRGRHCPTAQRAVRHRAVRRHPRSEEHTSELQSLRHLVCRLL